MVRTQIQFEERQYQQIRTLAHRKRISISEAVRRLVRQSLREGLKQKQTGVEALLNIAGIAASGVNHLGRRHDDYLAETYDK